MSAPDLTTEVMQHFSESGTEKHSTILLGAGASTTSGLPDWDTFAKRLLIQSGSVATEDVADLLIKHQDPLLVAEAARVALKETWDHDLRSALYEGVNSLDPSPLHRATVAHMLRGDEQDTTLVTLNFDPLLEQAIANETGSMPLSLAGDENLLNELAVHHLHGVITPWETASVVLTLTDFNSLIADHASWQAELFKTAVQRGALIIAGTSYRDPDVRQWLHKALSEKPGTHQALVLLARQGFSLTKVEFEQVKRALGDQWRAIGLTPVLLEDHSDAAQIIQELRDVHRDGYLAPQVRSTAIWEAHTARFEELQSEYVATLERDAETMKSALGVERLNLTLWIANGEGKLVRWAAQDRIYRDPEMLRGVDTGHDSPWIAGQALGTDALLHKDLDSTGTRQWQSVLAIPVPVPHPTFATFSSAVLTIGLSAPAERFERTAMLWGEPLAQISDTWGQALSSVAFGD